MSRRVARRCVREEPAEGVIGPGLRVGRIYLRAHMSVDGTFRTCRAGCLESVMRSKGDIRQVLLTYSYYTGKGLIALQFGTSPKPVRPYPISAEQIPSLRC